MLNRQVALIMTLILALVLGGTVMAQGTASLPVSDRGITPYIIAGENEGGNRTCEEVGLAFFGDADYYELTTGKIDYEGSVPGDWEPITVVTNGTFVSWAYDGHAGLAAIVKGSNDANVYVYDSSYTYDSGLASPFNASGQPAGLSNLTFCWNPKDVEQCFEDETGWADGDRYVDKGNWATYTPYAPDKVVTLFAGKNMVAGEVTFSAENNGEVTITIDLFEGWYFDYEDEEGEIEESVHIQGYESPPSGNPAPGQFEYKYVAMDEPFVAVVDAANYFGVHVALLHEVPCPEPEVP